MKIIEVVKQVFFLRAIAIKIYLLVIKIKNFKEFKRSLLVHLQNNKPVAG